MEQHYDEKFEEMKKYIPFLERMIKRLESNRTTSGNPRQAQLAKIRSLRDLLLDKKKRMKMENLLKCEQVLINLYAKVEQRECYSEINNDVDTSVNTQNDELNLVRNKLKNVVSHLKDQETLPEIARASITDEACTVGSKEPALFQRRPNKTSSSPPRASLTESKISPSPSSNRNYSRVLISPELDKNWTHENSSDKPLYSRRSPHRTPKKSPRSRLSPHHKKERKKSTSQPQDSNESKDFNITLKVPEASLNSLNTKDIVSRIINCNDNDVDIDTLRGLRTQILSELKQTGAKDDISDLILQSYKTKKQIGKRKEEIEEGELSDSESEVIESIYGSLVIVDKEQNNTSATRKSDNKNDESRKIQICLVINSEKDKQSEPDKCNDSSVFDQSDFESFRDSAKDLQNVDTKNYCESINHIQDDVLGEVGCSKFVKNKENLSRIEPSNMPMCESSEKCNESKNETNTKSESLEALMPNFYKPPISVEQSKVLEKTNITLEEKKISIESSKKQEHVEIPLLDMEATATQEVVHEIDILQALKKEILSEKMSLSDSETVTPALHQPKVTKVANMHGLITKKRISIEKYKEKATASSKPCLFPNQTKSVSLNEELLKKQSLKLTEKEYERFNLSNRLAFDESSEDEDLGKRSLTIEDVFADLAPKSPDHEDFADTGIKPPVIIPADPIKTSTVVPSKVDVDMRLPAGFSPSLRVSKLGNKKDAKTTNFEMRCEVPKSEVEINSNENRVVPLGDPRVRREFNNPAVDTSILGPVDRTSRPLLNLTPNVISQPNSNTSGVIQNSNGVPNPLLNTGIYEMTPSRQNFENDDYVQKSHVYTSTFPVSNIYESNDMVNNFVNVRTDMAPMNNDFHKSLFAEKPSALLNILECPQTPIHPFGISECPPTPTHAFGLLETPMTPIPPFGRCDVAMTPVHPFDCPPTPNHPFGGRTETIMTPTHPFGMADFSQNQVTAQIPPPRYISFQDSRVDRSSDYNNFMKFDNEKDCNEYNERNSRFKSRNFKSDQLQRNYSDNYRHYGRQQSNAHSNHNHYEQCHDSESHHYNDVPRRESSHSMSRNYKSSRQYSVERKEYRGRDYRYENDSGRHKNEGTLSRNSFNREQSIGRNIPDDRNLKKNDIDFTSDNILSVEGHAGRTFIIDSSVNRSFQELKVSSFDARRRRASSVGRSLLSEQNFRSETTNTKFDKGSLNLNRNINFRRAQSVGREIESQEEKNFKDIKEELKSYKRQRDETLTKSKNNYSNKTIVTQENKKINERDPRISRRDEYDYRRDKNDIRTTNTSTPRGYYRDPRLYRENYKDSQKRYHDYKRGSSREIKKRGIVYSADNIAKGTILGSGYGVKNYKIPKIKKASLETVNRNENDKLFKDNTMDENFVKKVKDDSEKINYLKQKQEKKEGKRLTRWNNSEKIVPEVEKDFAGTKTIKPEVEFGGEENMPIVIPDNFQKRATETSLQNSVSESTEVSNNNINNLKEFEHNLATESTEMINLTLKKENSLKLKKNENEIKKKIKKDEDNDISWNEKELKDDSQLDYKDCNHEEMKCSGAIKRKIINTKDLKIDVISNTGQDIQSGSASEDNGFGVEFEMFSDNVVTDPVIENINAIIADLDDELKTPKNNNINNQFTQDIKLGNTLDNIACPSEKSPDTHDKAKIKESKLNLVENTILSMDTALSLDVNAVDVIDVDVPSDEKHDKYDNSGIVNKSRAEINTDTSIHNSEVSTTADDKAPDILNGQNTQNEDHIGSCSTPDSTIEVNENNRHVKIQDGVPDSTIEFNSEMSSDITSTHISHEFKDNVEISTLRNDNKNSIDSFLSILKDKSKMKELLTMLQDQSSENFKLKKKLEKLSEIVSDDEDVSSESNISIFPDSNESKNVKINNLPMNNERSNSIEQEKDEKNYQQIQTPKHECIIKKAEELRDKDQIDEEEKFAKPQNEIDDNLNDTSCSESNSVGVKPVQTIKKHVKNIKAGKKDKAFKESSPDMAEKPIKKTSRELKQLQEDIKEMFLHDGFTTNNTGIRMCRLAKLVEDKASIEKDEKNYTENKPVVLLEKVKKTGEDITLNSKIKKKQTSQSKVTQKEDLAATDNDTKSTIEPKTLIKLRPGPKSKTKVLKKHVDSDPYVFQSDSFSESNNTTIGDSKCQNSSESECESFVSSNSYGSTEHLAEIKKKTKRKRSGWQTGVIKSKHKRKKIDIMQPEIPSTAEHLKMISDSIFDENCFTDITYCFKKYITEYSCRFCAHSGNDIVHHYKTQHPHSEIPLSRLSPQVAKAAVEQCHGLDFQQLRTVPSEKYICRFCFKEFSKKKSALEAFFWHVVNKHTGEYRQLCTECVNDTRCPFNLDIPPPPTEPKGQLTGYVCCKCNYTQVSLENLKSHVANRHDDVETEVFEINLSVMTKKFLYSVKNSMTELGPRVLRSNRLNQNAEEINDEQNSLAEKKLVETDKILIHSEKDLNVKEKRKGRRNKIQSKISYENDHVAEEISEVKETEDVQFDLEPQKREQDGSNINASEIVSSETCSYLENFTDTNIDCQSTSDDVFDYPHFKVYYTETGTKEYVCCINGVANHFQTPLLISFKKHVQIKHKEKWDGFCYVCKLIVTSQGNHYFKDCLEHFLDKHMDNFPLIEAAGVSQYEQMNNVEEDNKLSTAYFNVRPLSDLISRTEPQLNESRLPVIESVVSLGSTVDETSQLSDCNEILEKYREDEYKYEQAQADVLNRKNHIVLGIMMSREKSVHMFKCAGRFCSYSTDNAEDALRHAVTHERLGGESSLDCAYCDFDSSKNAVELVTHVFNSHGSCPFVCGQCFYRAAASQLVRAHQLRLHKNERTIIYRSTVTARSNNIDKILPREIAVPMYDCNQDYGACLFKTYTLGKFAEHLQARHKTDSEFSCWVCSLKLTRITDLIQHLKSHGFKVYQCTWCIHGADSEAELLAHASEKHPNKPPQAYLRIITNKERTSGYRVLPLAQFNNSKVTFIDVIPEAKKGNPVREAERSIDLEKLIGQTTEMMESIVTNGENETDDSAAANDGGNLMEPMETFDPEPLDQSREALVMGLQTSLLNQIQDELSANASSLAVITPIPPSEASPNLKKLLLEKSINTQQQISIKVEPEAHASAPEKSCSDVVYCIESDDDSPSHVIDLSSDDIPSMSAVNDKCESVRVPLSRLYKCGLCRNIILKSAAGFKRHVMATHAQELDKLTCAYCSYIGERDAVVKHYLSEHSLAEDALKRYICGVCGNKYATFPFVKKHLKDDHNLTKLVVSSKQITNEEYQFVVSEASKPFKGAKQPVTYRTKRKLSSDKSDKSSPATKTKKYGLHNIDTLPITPILDELVYCDLCEFSTKVRLNMVRHLQLHAEQQPVPQTNPVNPVPHLETNEMHFDKMLNLASSSRVQAPRADKANKVDQQPVVNPLIPPETISRYPKYVPDRQRYTCGAKDCCYTSVGESMFKYHWETLHSETNDYRCIHCPPHQHVDTSKPINATRIIAHLKMHDIRLYACSSCPFYHNRRQIVEKHVGENHASGYVMVVREEGEAVPTASNVNQTVNATPTMDLKPWQCGLCKFKSMLRPEVVDHCAKVHQSKMQYKCTYCAFRTSDMENIKKHQSKSHADRAEDTFYFYYREGTIPDEPDGSPRWQMQRQKSGLSEAQVKTEAVENKELECQDNSRRTVIAPPPITIPVVDLKIVKKETDADLLEQPVRDLCETFGQFCEPNGLKYKCPLCEIVSEENREAMQSHLYEELQYRKWGCGFCPYKAFHKNGLKEHMNTEHRQYREPIELPVDSRVEIWIAKALDHQFLLIEKGRQNIAKQAVANPSIVPKSKQAVPALASESSDECDANNLQIMFGSFGEPEGMQFSCPKCNYKVRDETLMRDHLEIELHKIRWCCNSCTQKFQNYHEAQFHCKSEHPGEAARAMEAVRDGGKRSAWLSALLLTQKHSMAASTVPSEPPGSLDMSDQNSAPENSLLVVRYEERIATPELENASLVKMHSNDSDEDEQRLVIDESTKVAVDVKQCIFCSFKCKDFKDFKEHINQHNNIKPYFCLYCDMNGHRKTLLKHLSDVHKGQPVLLITKAQRGLGPPLKSGSASPAASASPTEDDKLICLRCEKSFSDNDAKCHTHENVKLPFARKGDVVVKCCVCLRLHESIEAATAHHEACHPHESLNYAYYKLQSTKRSVFCCAYCEQQFKFWRDFKVHCKAIHSSLPLKFNKRNFSYRVDSASDMSSINLSDDDESLKRKSDSPLEGPAPKRSAGKCTPKLPTQSVAKKSTAKLPLTTGTELDKGSTCNYGSEPSSGDLDNVRTRLNSCNTDISCTYKQLTEATKIDPVVLVKDVTK